MCFLRFWYDSMYFRLAPFSLSVAVWSVKARTKKKIARAAQKTSAMPSWSHTMTAIKRLLRKRNTSDMISAVKIEMTIIHFAVSRLSIMPLLWFRMSAACS